MVLRPGIRARNVAPVPGQALHGKVRKPGLRRPPDAFYAVLSVVQEKGEAQMEAEADKRQMHGLRLGRQSQVLEILRLVPGTVALA